MGATDLTTVEVLVTLCNSRYLNLVLSLYLINFFSYHHSVVVFICRFAFCCIDIDNYIFCS